MRICTPAHETVNTEPVGAYCQLCPIAVAWHQTPGVGCVGIGSKGRSILRLRT